VFAPPCPFLQNVQRVRETEILEEQPAPQGVFVCDHAGPVITKFSGEEKFLGALAHKTVLKKGDGERTDGQIDSDLMFSSRLRLMDFFITSLWARAF